MPGNPLTDPNWAQDTTDWIVSRIDQVREQTTGRVITIARALVFGIIAIVLGAFIAVVALIGVTRAVQSLIELATSWERAVYLSYLVIGLVFTVGGLLLFRKRYTAE